MISLACTTDKEAKAPSSEGIKNYCRQVDYVGTALGELQTAFKRKGDDPTAPAHNIQTVFADQVDRSSADLQLEDEWAVVVSNQTNTQLWRVYAERVERNPEDKSSLIALSSLVGHAQGACDAWRDIKGIPKGDR